MKEFQRKKETNLLFTSFPQKDNSFLGSNNEQSKNLYDFALKHDSQIKIMEVEITNLKSQLMEITMLLNSSQSSKNNSVINIEDKSTNSYLNQIIRFKEDIKNELMTDINNLIYSENNEVKEQLENLKEEIKLFNEEKNNNKSIEIIGNLESLNQQLMQKDSEKNNMENIILGKINNDKMEINNTINNIIKRMDNFDLDFDRLIQSLKTQFLTNADTISQLDLSKLNITDYEKQINLINQNFDVLNNKLNDINQKNNNSNINKKIILNNNNGIDNNYIGVKNELTSFKNEIYNDFEKINIKVLNELKNQAHDIKIIYQKMNNIDNINNIKNKQRDLNFQSPNNLNNHSVELYGQKDSESLDIISLMESELSKKANLDQLNFALEAQAKLNEAFSSASRICRFCWDSEGLLKDDKFIIWSIQNLNTALDVFRWENNSENITILQNGIYKIILGLIGLEKNKFFGIIFNDEENIILNSRNNNNNNNYGYENENENDMSDKGNVKYIEKYIACVGNTKLKAVILDNNSSNSTDNNDDNSEEAFLEIIKII